MEFPLNARLEVIIIIIIIITLRPIGDQYLSLNGHTVWPYSYNKKYTINYNSRKENKMYLYATLKNLPLWQLFKII